MYPLENLKVTFVIFFRVLLMIKGDLYAVTPKGDSYVSDRSMTRDLFHFVSLFLIIIRVLLLAYYRLILC